MYKTQQKLKLDIIISGWEEDKYSIREVIESLQAQLQKVDRSDIGAMFAFGNKKDNNIKEVLHRAINEMSNSEYYTVLDCSEQAMVMPNYVERIIELINEAETGGDESKEKLILLGINTRK